MHARRLHTWLLLASLLFGLWVAAVHGPEHPGLLAHADDCAVCVFAQGLGGGLAASLANLLLAKAAEPDGVVQAPARPELRPRHVRVRGPPSHLA